MTHPSLSSKNSESKIARIILLLTLLIAFSSETHNTNIINHLHICICSALTGFSRLLSPGKGFISTSSVRARLKDINVLIRYSIFSTAGVKGLTKFSEIPDFRSVSPALK